MTVDTTEPAETSASVTAGTVKTSDVVIGSDTIGHKDDTGLISLANGSVNVTGSLQTSSLNLGGTAVTASAADINKLTNLSTLKSELEFVSGVSSSIQDQLDSK